MFSVSPATSTTQLVSTQTPATNRQHMPARMPPTAGEGSVTPGSGTGWKGWGNWLASCFVDREEWGQFFIRHFTSSSFNKPDESGTIDNPVFHKQKDRYVSQLQKKARGSSDIPVSFRDLPECRAEGLSQSLMVRRKHVSLFLIQLTLRELNKVWEENAGKEWAAHIDLSRRPAAAEEGVSHPERSTQQKEGFFVWSFKDIANAMAHIGTLSRDPENKGIPGLTITADLSGLKIEHPDELRILHNLIVRSAITGIHVDLSLIEPNLQNEAWRTLERTLSTDRARYLRDLTLEVPAQSEARLSYMLADALSAPECHLQSLTLIDSNWTVEAKARLSEAVRKRQDMGRPLTITIDGEKLEPHLQ